MEVSKYKEGCNSSSRFSVAMMLHIALFIRYGKLNLKLHF